MDPRIPAIDKLLELVASGIGSVAGPLLAPWKARKEGQAKMIAAQAEAGILRIQTKAHVEAREVLAGNVSGARGQISISDRINERILYQEEKRLCNTESVVAKAANELEGKEVQNNEPDHDWAARFFNYVQDVSSEHMQTLWAKVLAGEVERSGSTSLPTLSILRDLDRTTAKLFVTACSACVYLVLELGGDTIDARVPTLGGEAGANALRDFGLGFGELNRLNERGLIISDYHSWFDYRLSIVPGDPNVSAPNLPFEHQNQSWLLLAQPERNPQQELKIHGVALSNCGRELASVVDRIPMSAFTERLRRFFDTKKLKMVPISQE